MEQHHKEEIKRLFSESLREKHDSYIIHELFQQFPTTRELLDVSEDQLLSIRGIGISKARQITSMIQLTKAFSVPSEANHVIRSPKDVFNLLMPDLRHQTKEHFICLFLNTKNKVIYKETVSIGSLNSAIVHPREVFRAAIKRCSASLICAHNHPSGDPTPSPEDVNLTKRLINAGEIVGIEVLDHIIIGNPDFISLREQGLI